MIWALVAGVSFAAPEPRAILAELQVPPGVQVEATVVNGRWRFVVSAAWTRTLDVQPPSTPEERAAVLALLESLFVDLRAPTSIPEPEPEPEVLPQPFRIARATHVDVGAELLPWPDVPLLVIPRTMAPPPTVDAMDTEDPPHTDDRVSRTPRTPAVDTPAAPAVDAPAAPAVAGSTVRTPPSVQVPAERVSDPIGSGGRIPRPGRLETRPAAHHLAPPAEPRPLPPRLPRPSPVVPWVAVDAAARPGVALAGGGSVGATVPAGSVLRMGLGVSVHPRQSVSVAPLASFAEGSVDLDVSAQPTDWLRIRGGAGVAVRDYVQYDARVMRAALPRASAGAEVTWRGDRWAVAVGAAIDVDLGRVEFDVLDRSTYLFPLAARPTIRVEFPNPADGSGHR